MSTVYSYTSTKSSLILNLLIDIFAQVSVGHQNIVRRFDKGRTITFFKFWYYDVVRGMICVVYDACC
jgi:hypothetical protein